MDKSREVKILISSLLISAPTGVTVKNLNKDYLEQVGTEIPYKSFGYSNLESYLHSISDVCRIQGSGQFALVIPVVSEKVKHINDMVLKQRKPKTSGRKYPVVQRPRGIEQKTTNHKQYQSNANTNYPHYRNKKYKEEEKTESQKQSVEEDLLFNENVANFFNSCHSHKQNIKWNANTLNLDSNNEIPLEFYNSQLNNSLSHHTKYSQHTSNRSSNSPDLNYSLDSGSTSSCSSENKFSDTESKPNLLKTINVLRKLVLKEKEKTLFNDYVSEKVDKQVKNNLKLLIQEHPDGIWCCKLSSYYKKKFGAELTLEDFGYSSMSEFCETLTDVFHIVRPGSTDWKVFDVRRPLPCLNTIKDLIQVKNGPLEPRRPKSYPENVLKPCDSIERQWLGKHQKEYSSLDILIADVYHPSNFYIQLQTQQQNLNKLVDEMQLFYEQHHKSYSMPVEIAVEAVFCCVYFSNEYHRARVIKFITEEQVQVFAIDYGTITYINVYDFYYLHKKFAELPQQAIPARLSNVIPRKNLNAWPKHVSMTFLELVKEKTLAGYISHIDAVNVTLSLIISYKEGNNIININNYLIENNLADVGNKIIN